MDRNRPPRIGIVLPQREHYALYGAGAVSTVVDGFARHSRFRVLLKVLGAPVERPLDGASFFPVRLAPFWHGGPTRRYLAEAARILKKDAALVEIHNRPKYVAYLRKALPGIPFALYLHNDPRMMEAAKTAEERTTLLESLQAVICVSDYIRTCFLDGLGNQAASTTHVVRNAVDTWALCPPADDGKRKEIIFIGRTIEDKGLHLLVEAAEKLLPSRPGWKLVVVGSRYFGSNKTEAYERELFRRIKALGSQGEVTRYLPRQETIARLQQASIAVLPSLWDEPIQLAAIEAAACSCAVITTRRGGIPEGMGDAALYLQEETPQEIGRLLGLLTGNPGLLLEQRQKAREHAMRSGDIRRAAERLDDIRQDLCPVFRV